MSVELRLIDHIRFSSKLSVNFACEYSEDDRILIIGDIGIYIIALKGCMSNPFPSYYCKNYFLEISDFTPSANIGIDINSFHKDLERNDLYEATMSMEYSADLKSTTPVDPSPLCAQWSPRGIVGKTDCLLAVLSNFYNLEIYVKFIDENEVTEYCMICGVTQEVIDEKKTEWKYSDRLPPTVKYNEMKRRVQNISCTAFTWSHLYKINGKEYCTIFVGHMNGDVTVWRITGRVSNSKENSKLHFLGRYSTQLGRIVRMHWHITKEYGGGLSFADSEGKMSVLHVKCLDQETADIDSELGFWTEADKVVVDKITVMIYDGRTYIILVKQSFLIIYGLDESGQVFDQKVCNVGCYYITGIHHFDNTILVLTLTSVLKQYTLSIVDQRIHLEEKLIPIKVNGGKFRTHGFFFSKNMVFFGLIAYPCMLHSFSKLKTFLNIFLFHNALLNPLTIIWHNNSGSLRDYWDCLEMLRLLCLKDKRFPWLGIPAELDYDNLSLLKLKTLRWLAKLSEMVFNTVPVVKNYDIKPYIILHYLVQIKLILKRLNGLLSKKQSGEELSLFQMRSIDIQNFFLKEMVVKNVLAKANVGRNFINEIKQVMRVANELRYPAMLHCVWCGEKIIGPVCLPPHADSRCSITMMPIYLVTSYKCPFCKALAHKEVGKEEDVIFCPYCDVPMEQLYADEKTEEFVNKDYELKSEEVRSVCFDDCLKEGLSFSDVEENEREYVVLSDSEDESSEDQNKLRTLYVRLKDVSLEDIVKLDNGEEQEAGPSRKVLKLTGGDG
ncbi:uncharacterized protein LOC108910411 [Anoplophora glabripennis]|uniref:uncharacterized protein LOC108910411 n=1 Tax=Anoplophora glabripennis TaxID=217634 RepID=UPI0008746852|nr:uncharacterized protein LOC108910411 [Anoplophora glabripennis]